MMQRNLLWKELREKWLLLAAAGLFVLLGSTLLRFALVSGAFGEVSRTLSSQDARRTFIVVLLHVCTWIAAILLGTQLLDARELEPTHFLYGLPISRRRILTRKLAALATFLAVLALLGAAYFVFPAGPVASPLGAIAFWVSGFLKSLLRTLLWALALALVAAIIRLHISSAIVSFVLAGLVSVPVLIFDSLLLTVSQGEHFAWMQAFWNAGVVALLVAAWLYFLFCRTAIQEKSPAARFLLLLLFIAGLYEASYTVLACNVRDLLFILLGV